MKRKEQLEKLNKYAYNTNRHLFFTITKGGLFVLRSKRKPINLRALNFQNATTLLKGIQTHNQVKQVRQKIRNGKDLFDLGFNLNF